MKLYHVTPKGPQNGRLIKPSKIDRRTGAVLEYAVHEGNATFELPAEPTVGLLVFFNGLFCPGECYTVNGKAVTFRPDAIPLEGWQVDAVILAEEKGCA